MAILEPCKLRVCMIGCGGMGTLHARALAQHADLGNLTLCDADGTRAQALADQLGAQTCPVDDALAQDGFDAYFIVSPPFAHLDQIQRAASTGAHVFCEKPLGEDIASIEKAMPALTDHADRIQIGFNRRFDPHMAELKRNIAAGAIGTVEQLRIVSRDHTAPQVGDLANSAGLIAETAIHDFDMSRWLLNGEIAEVFCMGGTLINPEYDSIGHIDTATILLRSTLGQQVVIQNSWRTSYGYDQRVEAFGGGGKMTVDNPSGPLVLREDGSGLHRGVIATDWLARYPEAYAIQAREFLDKVFLGKAVSPNLTDGYQASLIAQMAADSLTSGKPVRI